MSELLAATPPSGAAPPRPSDTRQAAPVAAALVLVLAVVGCVLGLVWAAWSPAGPAAERVPGGIIADETEAFIAGDGRFLVLTALVGVAAGVAAWYLRTVRGPLVPVALGVGGLAGAFLTRTVGHVVQGSSPQIHSHRHVFYAHLALDVHAVGLFFVEGALAVLVFALFVAFTAADDLGRPDPERDARRPVSVQPGWQSHDSGGHGDAPGALQQRGLPPQ